MLPGTALGGTSLLSIGTAAGTTAAAAGSLGTNPVADLAAINSLSSVVAGFFGRGETDTDRARLARAKAYLAGALAGSVKSARLALGAKQTNTSAEEQTLYTSVLAQIQSGAPAVYQAATAAGALHDDGADGRSGLQELERLGLRFSEPGAGHPTGYHQYGQTTPATMALVARLAALSMTPTGNPDVKPPQAVIPGDGVSAAPATAADAPRSSLVPWLLLLALGVGLFWIARKH